MISIIVPIYKTASTLQRCVDSLINQTLCDIEIILVDDGSPDDSPRICDQYCLADKRVRVIHKDNGGLSDARNAGLDVAAGDYVMFVDSDDFIELDSCETLVSVAQQYDADIVCADWRIIPSRKTRRHYTNIIEGRVYSSREFILDSLVKNEWYPCACFLLCRRSMFEERGLRFAIGLLHEDMEMQPRLFMAADRIVCSKYKFYNYVRHQDSITGASNRARRAHDMGIILTRWLKLFVQIEDLELREALLGYLSKCYLNVARECGVKNGLDVDGVTPLFLMRHGKNVKEKVKALLFMIAPALYVKL